MKKQITIHYEKLLDTIWDKTLEYKRIEFKINGANFNFCVNNSKPIRELPNLIDEKLFKVTMMEISAEILEPFDIFRSQNKLSLYFFENKYGIGIFSYGEWQPARFMMFFEAFIKN